MLTLRTCIILIGWVVPRPRAGSPFSRPLPGLHPAKIPPLSPPRRRGPNHPRHWFPACVGMINAPKPRPRCAINTDPTQPVTVPSRRVCIHCAPPTIGRGSPRLPPLHLSLTNPPLSSPLQTPLMYAYKCGTGTKTNAMRRCFFGGWILRWSNG